MRGDSDYLDLSATAQLLGVSRRTVARWVAWERLPAFVDGRIYRIHRDDLNAFIRERTTRKTA